MMVKNTMYILISAVLFSGIAYGADLENVITYTKTTKHVSSSGGKGIDTIFLKPPKSIGGQCISFSTAKVVYKKRRYGEVKINALPKASCNKREAGCKLKAKWKHAPAGKLSYTIKTIWKQKAC